MALTRAELVEAGLTAEQVELVIKGHTASQAYLKDQVAALTEENEKYKTQIPSLQKELEDLKANGGDAQKKYEEEHSAFEAYKSEQEAKETRQAVAEAYKNLLREAGVSEKRIAAVMKVADLDSLKLTDGKLEGADDLKVGIQSEWADFIENTETKGAGTKTPPGNDGGKTPDYENMSMAEYAAARKKG